MSIVLRVLDNCFISIYCGKFFEMRVRSIGSIGPKNKTNNFESLNTMQYYYLHTSACFSQ